VSELSLPSNESGPITPLEPLVVLIGRHKVYAREKISKKKRGFRERCLLAGAKVRRTGLEN
jgi:hypothetical protein